MNMQNRQNSYRCAAIARFKADDDSSLRSLGGSLHQVFASSKFCPPDELGQPETRESLDNAVKVLFPSRFADTYNEWRQSSTNLELAFELNDRVKVSSAFSHAMTDLKRAWKLILNFLPFVFITALHRAPGKVIQLLPHFLFSETKRLYDIVYHKSSRGTLESDQVKFLSSLLSLFRDLERRGEIDDWFILRNDKLPNLKTMEYVFPARFERLLLLINQIRNKEVHDFLAMKDPSFIQPMYEMAETALLDIVKLLWPVCAQYAVVYVAAEDVQAGTVRGLCFSGTGAPSDIQYRVHDVRADADSLHPDQLYLIDRYKQVGKSKDQVTPADYVCLTPFMLYTTGSPRSDSRTTSVSERQVFLFEAYNDTDAWLSFREFYGTRKFQFDASFGCNFQSVLAMYHQFLDHIEIVAPRTSGAAIIENDATACDSRASMKHALTETWRISLEHASTLIDSKAYQDDGTLITEYVPDKGARYDERLYESPTEEEMTKDFLRSDRRGIIFIGSSGMGKSSLLSHMFLTARRSGQLAVFIDSRRLHSSDFVTVIENEVANRIVTGWTATQLNTWLEGNSADLLLFVDAINEYTGAGGCLKLLDSIIRGVSSPHVVGRARVVATCRSESWRHYQTLVAKDKDLLDRRFFFSEDGDPINITGFQSEERRSRLYQRYQSYHGLIPDRYEDLDPNIQEILRTPFLLSLVATIYSNRNPGIDQPVSDRSSLRIPRKMDYFRLFRELNVRKAQDALRMLPDGDPARDGVLNAIEDFLLGFARSVLATTLTPERDSGQNGLSLDTATSGRQTVSYRTLRKSSELAQYLTPFGNGHISLLEILLDLGILEHTSVKEVDHWGTQRTGRGYRFFHDQYTQYWLGAVYNADVIGSLNSRSQLQSLRRAACEVAKLIEEAKNVPVLQGGLDHWMFANMSQGTGRIVDLLVPFLNILAEPESGGATQYVADYLHSLPERGVLSYDKLFSEVFSVGVPALKTAVVGHIPILWPRFPTEGFVSLLRHLDDSKDDEIIRELADVYAELFGSTPIEALEYLSHSLEGIEGLGSTIVRALSRHDQMISHVGFLAKFAVKATLSQFRSVQHMIALRNFIRSKFTLIVSALEDVNAASISPSGLVRRIIFRKMESTGVNQWNEAIGSQGGNNLFFKDDCGVVQRDILYAFVPYCVGFYNEEIEMLDLSPGTEFRALAIQMLSFRPSSVIGYVSALIVAGVLRSAPDQIESFVDELLSKQTDGASYFSLVMLTNLAFYDHEQCLNALNMMRDGVIPRIGNVKSPYDSGWLEVLAVASIDLVGNWPLCASILDQIAERYSNGKEDPKVIGDTLACSCFYPDISIGKQVLGYMLEPRPSGKVFPQDVQGRVAAAMYCRNPLVLREMLAERGMELEAALPWVRSHVDDRLIEMKDEFSYQASWNEFIIAAATQLKPVLYFLVHDLLVGLVQSNSVEDFSLEFRRFVVNTANHFMSQTGGRTIPKSFTFNEALQSTEVHRLSVHADVKGSSL